MHFTSTVAAAILLFAATSLTAPIPQLAGEGAALDSIFSSTDNGVGYGVENAEDNTANLISGTNSASPTGGPSGNPPPPPPPPHRRQLAGEGAALNSIFSSTDNGIGYGVENAEDNTANLISGTNSASPIGGSSGNPPPPPPPPHRRQLDKIANGFGAIGNAAGVSVVTNPVVAAGDSADGTLTSGAANAGSEVGGLEESTLIGVGKSVPKFRRQLDKIANGLGAIGDAAGVSSATNPVVAAGDSVDGTLTSAAANAGAQVGSTEESTLISAGKAVPK